MPLRKLLNLLGFTSNKRWRETQRPDIRYAHPSHDPNHNNNKSPTQPIKLTNETENLFRNLEALKTIITTHLKTKGRDGDSYLNVNLHAATMLTDSPALAQQALNKKWIRDNLKEARSQLNKEGLIGYNKKDEIWYIKPNPIRNLTDKEQRYLAAQGLGEGWRNISSEIDAIEWLHKNLSPDEFEHFCISILSAHCKVPITITEKRPISGADGGFDGTGEWVIHGNKEPIALQAKKYASHNHISEDHCDRFAGALLKRGWKYGFLITTSVFSPRLKESVEVFKSKDIWIELIDQERLAEIMLMKGNSPHGFGLHRTDYGLVYINEAILKNAATDI